MINLETVRTLRTLRLPGMARELESQLEAPQHYKALSFEDCLALLVDAENISRRQNTIQRRITEARLSESQACIEAIEYHEDRELECISTRYLLSQQMEHEQGNCCVWISWKIWDAGMVMILLMFYIKA